MSANQAKNSGVLRPATFDAKFNSKLKTYQITLSSIPDVNPYEGGTEPSSQPILYLKKITDDLIWLQWPLITGTAGAATKLSWLQKIPSECRPKTDVYATVPIINNGSSAAGLLKIGSNGSLTFSTAADGTFTDSGTCAIRAGSTSWARC